MNVPSCISVRSKIEADDFSPLVQQRRCERSADKARRAGDQDSLVHARPPSTLVTPNLPVPEGLRGLGGAGWADSRYRTLSDAFDSRRDELHFRRIRSSTLARGSRSHVMCFDMFLLQCHHHLGPSCPPRVSEVVWSMNVRCSANEVRYGRRVSFRLSTSVPPSFL